MPTCGSAVPTRLVVRRPPGRAFGGPGDTGRRSAVPSRRSYRSGRWPLCATGGATAPRHCRSRRRTPPGMRTAMCHHQPMCPVVAATDHASARIVGRQDSLAGRCSAAASCTSTTPASSSLTEPPTLGRTRPALVVTRRLTGRARGHRAILAPAFRTPPWRWLPAATTGTRPRMQVGSKQVAAGRRRGVVPSPRRIRPVPAVAQSTGPACIRRWPLGSYQWRSAAAAGPGR